MKPNERCERIRGIMGEIMVQYEDELRNLRLLSSLKDVIVQLRILEVEVMDKNKLKI